MILTQNGVRIFVDSQAIQAVVQSLWTEDPSAPKTRIVLSSGVIVWCDEDTVTIIERLNKLAEIGL